MTTSKKKSGINQSVARKPGFKELDVTTKHNKATAHKPVEKRIASKVRGR